MTTTRRDPVRIVGDEPIPVQIISGQGGDPFSATVLTVIDYPHHEVHEGNMFFCSHSSAQGAPLANAASMTFHLAFASQLKAAHFSMDCSCGGDALFFFYRNPTINVAGSLESSFNMNELSNKLPQLIVRLDPTVGAVGTTIFDKFIPGGSGPQAVGSHLTLRPGTEHILNPANSYLVRITNVSGAPQYTSLSIQWYEELI